MVKINNSKISACIVIPTYNESENIGNLLNKIFDPVQNVEYKKSQIHLTVLVVDDNSPDGTALIVKDLQKKNANIHLLLREKKNGLGSAYIAGMQYALIMIKPDIIFEMDADLSHNPSYIIPMIGKIRDGADFVIGSRYTKGGTIPDEWGYRRRLISSLANTYSRVILRLSKIKDCTGGFRAMRSSILERIDLENLNSKGYVFQISLLNAVKALDARIVEIPIHFEDRKIGKSKMEISDITEVGARVFLMGITNLLGSNQALVQESVIYDKSSGTIRGVKT